MSDITTGLVFADEPAAPETFNALLYGAPKSGKSTAAATAPGPILWVSAEGPGALAYARKTARDRGTRIMEVRVTNGDDVRTTLREVVKFVRTTRGTDAPRTVVVDTIAKVREALIKQLVQPGSKHTLQQFGEVADVIRGFVRTLRDEPVNLVLIAHQDIADADDGRVVRPLIGGALTAELPGEVDILAFCHSFLRDADDEGAPPTRVYVGQLVEGKGREAGDRSGGLGSWRELDLSEWLTAYRAALAPDESDVPWGADPSHPDDEPQAHVTSAMTPDNADAGEVVDGTVVVEPEPAAAVWTSAHDDAIEAVKVAIKAGMTPEQAKAAIVDAGAPAETVTSLNAGVAALTEDQAIALEARVTKPAAAVTS